MKNPKLMKIIAFIAGCLMASAYLAFAATDIDHLGAGEQWGWNDVIGWLDMKSTGTVLATPTVQGYASSSVGAVMFDCATTPAGDTCASPASTAFAVTKDAAGLMTGFAWNDAVGWVSMSGTTADAQAYQVRVAPYGDGIRSYVRGFAWNDVTGWMSFDCLDGGGCAGNPYRTETSADAALASPSAEVVSKLFDLGTASGVINTISWKGSQPAGSTVDFKIATADAASALMGDMDAVFAGSSWVPVTAYPASPVKLTAAGTGATLESRRYFRYRLRLSGAGNSPRIDDIVIGWSP